MFNSTSSFNKTLLCSVGALLFSASFAAKAAEAYDDQMARINAQISLVQKQNELAEALAKTAGPAAMNMPSIVAIIGMDGELSARLMMANGVVGTYKEGDPIRAGMTVSVITPKLVILKVGKGKSASPIALEFIAGAYGTNPRGGNPDSILPGLLPLPPAIQMTPFLKTPLPPAPAAEPAPKTSATTPAAKTPTSQPQTANPLTQETNKAETALQPSLIAPKTN